MLCLKLISSYFKYSKKIISFLKENVNNFIIYNYLISLSLQLYSMHLILAMYVYIQCFIMYAETQVRVITPEANLIVLKLLLDICIVTTV